MAGEIMSNAELSHLRTQAEEALPDIVTIERLTRTPDAVGGFTEAWQPVYTDVAARMAEVKGDQGIVLDRESGTSVWTLTLAYSQDITTADRIRYGGDYYQVTFVAEGRSYSTAKRCLVRRVM